MEEEEPQINQVPKQRQARFKAEYAPNERIFCASCLKPGSYKNRYRHSERCPGQCTHVIKTRPNSTIKYLNLRRHTVKNVTKLQVHLQNSNLTSKRYEEVLEHLSKEEFRTWVINRKQNQCIGADQKEIVEILCNLIESIQNFEFEYDCTFCGGKLPCHWDDQISEPVPRDQLCIFLTFPEFKHCAPGHAYHHHCLENAFRECTPPISQYTCIPVQSRSHNGTEWQIYQYVLILMTSNY